MNQLTKLETARSIMSRSHTFYACVMLNTPFVEDKTIPTLGTDMKKICYNQAFIDSLDMLVVVFAIAHEVLHIVLLHGVRRGPRNQEVWNNACDFVINATLKRGGFRLWEYALYNSAFEGMYEEQVYELLIQDPAYQQARGGSSPSMDGDLLPLPPGTAQAEVEKITSHIRHVVAQAVVLAKSRGQMPGDLEMIVSSTFDDPVSWDKVLLDYMTRVIQVNETWSRPNRRFEDVILPSRRSLGMSELVIIADSSGSMYEKAIFERIATAVNYIVTVVKPMLVRVIWADDAECSNIDMFEQGEEVVLHPKGGGGTDMCKPLRYVERYEPEVVLLITDGITPWPEVPTSFPLIVACTTDAPTPKWAASVRITVGG